MNNNHVEQLEIGGMLYSLVKQRLAGGGIYRAEDGSQYLRIGDPDLTAEEHVHLVALKNRGYPVSEVIASGRLDGQYYFIEKSLGEKPFAVQFGEEYQESGEVSDAAFSRYLGVMRRYANASFNPNNHRHAKPNIRDISLLKYTAYQYGLDQERMDRLFAKAEVRLAALPSVEIHEDLGPFNTMDLGVIDFETVQNKDGSVDSSRFGPMGFDVLAGPITGYYFPKVDGYHHKLLYEFSKDQLSALKTMLSGVAAERGVPDPNDFMQEFLLMRTVWAAARNLGYEHKAYEDPEKERFWSEFRANILHYVIDAYEKGELIDPERFPEIGLETG